MSRGDPWRKAKSGWPARALLDDYQNSREGGLEANDSPAQVTVTESGYGPYGQIVTAGHHVQDADEPEKLGGHDTGCIQSHSKGDLALTAAAGAPAAGRRRNKSLVKHSPFGSPLKVRKWHISDIGD